MILFSAESATKIALDAIQILGFSALIAAITPLSLTLTLIRSFTDTITCLCSEYESILRIENVRIYLSLKHVIY